MGRAKIVLVGDAYQLSPVKARGGMFEQLCAELPWTQRLGEVWRMRDHEERDASLALRSGHGNRLRKAVGWYRNHDRLHTGDPIAMADDALTAYLARPRRRQGRGDHLRHMGDRRRDQPPPPRRPTPTQGPTARVARDQDVGSATSSSAATTTPPSRSNRGPRRRGERIDQVRNGNRWRVAVDAKRNRSRPSGSPTTPASSSRATTARARHPGLRHHRARRPRHHRRPPHALLR